MPFSTGGTLLRLSPISPAEFATCDQEPIHTPGQIQPHGILVATAPGTARISHVSANFQRLSGLDPRLVLGAELAAVFGDALWQAIERGFQSGNYTPANVMHVDVDWKFLSPAGEPQVLCAPGLLETLHHRPALDLHGARAPAGAEHGDAASSARRSIVAHRHLDRIFLEIEAADQQGVQENILGHAQTLIGSLRDASSTAELCEIAARSIRRLVSYDRVMIYRFDDAGNGVIVAEDKADTLEPFVGLCYPATDIPQQARRLYVQQRVRAIPDIHYTPVGLHIAPAEAGAAPLDMSYCALRAVSPVHLEYMRNMGVCGTLVASLLNDGRLTGMIVCHHDTPRTPSAASRSLLDVVGQLLSLLIQRADEAHVLADRLSRTSYMSALRFDSDLHESVATTLSSSGTALLNLVGASGVLVRLGDRVHLIGKTPERSQALAILDSLQDERRGEIIVVSDAGKPGGLAESCPEMASGVLVVPILNNPNDAIAWFRPEAVQSVRWAGDPALSRKAEISGSRMSPRNSFLEWCEIVRGRSVPWSDVDLQTATELRRTIADVLLHQAEAKLAHLSAYDALTVLANRRTIKLLIDRFRVERTTTHAAMLFLDLDRFKAINDTLSHAAGDQVLIQTAARLRHIVPEGATPGRLGGDEFVVFWPGASQDEAIELARSLLKGLSEPFVFENRQYRTTASVGVAHGGLDGVDQLLREADEAMYVAKRQGGAQIAVFEPALHERIVSAVTIEQDLFLALQRNELDVHYQPIVTVPARRVCGFEALVRWRHPVRGWIPPPDFIPRAEESGLILQLGAFVFASAVRQIAVWRKHHGPLTMSINVSARQLNDGSFPSFAARTLAAAGVPADAIYIEVTESALMDGGAVRELHLLRNAGFKVAVDDFGTGYSSLSYLQRLPVDCTKVDKAFVQPAGCDARAGRFLSSIVSLSRTLELKTIAEGCETEEQWRALCTAGCDAAQGWLISQALSASGVDDFLAREGFTHSVEHDNTLKVGLHSRA